MGSEEQSAFDKDFAVIVSANGLQPVYGPRQQALLAAIDHRIASGPPLSDTDKDVAASLAHILNLGRIPINPERPFYE